MRAEHYESLGARAVYRLVAFAVREPLIPGTTGDGSPLCRSRLTDMLAGTRYFRSANVARALCYLPHLVTFWMVRSAPGLACVATLGVVHGILVWVESYKAALCRHWLLALPDGQSLPATRPKAQSPRAPFRLLSFESDRFYRMIGVEAFRQLVTRIMSLLANGPSGGRMEFIAKPNRSQIVAFEQGTRVSELVHWLSALSVLPLVVVSFQAGPLGIKVWSCVIIWGDVMLALLQRYHRARVWPLMKRVLERAD